MSEAPENIQIERLCTLARNGDVHAERELFERLTDSFRAFAQLKIRDGLEAEEAVQDALTVVAQKYKEMTFHTGFAGWAFVIIRNVVYGRVRQKVHRTSRYPKAETGPDDVADPRVPEAVLSRMLKCFEQVARQNRRFARALNLHYQGFTADEICTRLGIKRGYFYVVLARARSMLESCLGIGED